MSPITLNPALPVAAPPGAIGFGYEGHEAEDLIARLYAAGVEIVVDVRLTPISRKRGLSKKALRQALAEVGIDYIHLRALGNPKDNRAGFASESSERDTAVSTFRMLLAEPAAAEALDEIRRLASDRRVALLCFEAEEARCHRHVILEALAGGQ
ncbi:hypothetical protein GCM10027447_02120 [Glycomyces halotolerans]